MLLVAVEEEKGGKGGRVVVAFIAMIFVVVGAGFITAELTEGLPKNAYALNHPDCMPPENSPLIIKMINVENNYAYITTVLYNEPGALKWKYYQIPIEHIEDLGSMETGMIVINDNGVLKPFKNN